MKPADPVSKSRFVFLTLPNYSMIALTNALEPLRSRYLGDAEAIRAAAEAVRRQAEKR